LRKPKAAELAEGTRQSEDTRGDIERRREETKSLKTRVNVEKLGHRKCQTFDKGPKEGRAERVMGHAVNEPRLPEKTRVPTGTARG